MTGRTRSITRIEIHYACNALDAARHMEAQELLSTLMATDALTLRRHWWWFKYFSTTLCYGRARSRDGSGDHRTQAALRDALIPRAISAISTGRALSRET